MVIIHQCTLTYKYNFCFFNYKWYCHFTTQYFCIEMEGRNKQLTRVLRTKEGNVKAMAIISS